MAFSVIGRVLGNLETRFAQTRWYHFSLPVPLQRVIDPSLVGHSSLQSPFTSPHLNHEPEIPKSSSSAFMELMAVPKKKVSRHKRGIRNGPKALKPVPVIMRCKSCGRVKLPHFFCCSGRRGTRERTESVRS